MKRSIRLVPVLLMAAAAAHAETTQCTPITFAPVGITTQGVYCLTDDVKVAMDAGVAIEIAANGVVLDFNGHRLSNSSGPSSSAVGITAVGRQNVTIKNGSIRGFYTAVNMNSVQSSVLEHMRIDQSWHHAILANGQGLVVRDNLVLLTGGTTFLAPNADAYGIVVSGISNSILRNDVVTVTAQGTGNSAGIFFSGPSGSIAVGNRISQAARAIVSDSPTGGKYRDTLSSGITLAPYSGGTDAGNNN
jgi:hypothetical protein